MSGFDALHPAVQHHIVNTLGWRDLRPLQDAAAEPLVAGEDALLLAPTAGGKTEAAVFPLLTRMSAESWTGTSILYICPLRALLNNLELRLDTYAKWLGRSAAVRHGDTAQSVRRRLAAERPDVLMTTPESIEAMLVSSTLDPRSLLGDVRAVIVDEIHAFAGDDRGWHLLAVLERLTRLVERPLQRVGLSATVGNPGALLQWLQASNLQSGVAGTVISPPSESVAEPDVALDYVGSVDNAAKVVSLLHRGEKRLVFADSRRTVERLGVRLGDLDVDTYVSHSSLSATERRRSETAFAGARDCVIVATSTLELGIDVGDLDRVLQVGAPTTVASFLQRLGRTGRRPGTRRNMTVLTVDDDELLRASGLLLLWSEGWVETIAPPPAPAHIAAQQLLALALQEGQVGRHLWRDWLGGLALSSATESELIVDTLVERGVLHVDGDMLMVGNEAERRYGRRHFMEVMSVFTSNPQVAVLHGRTEIGTVDPMVLLAKVMGPRRLALAGRAWTVNAVDWAKKKAYVEPAQGVGMARWLGSSIPLSGKLVDAMRRVLLGADLGAVGLTARASARLQELRHEWADRVDPTRTVVLNDPDDTRWWTWAGGRANALLHAALEQVAPRLCDEQSTFTNHYVSFRRDIAASELRDALDAAVQRFGSEFGLVEPAVSKRAVQDLKFGDLLPEDLAVRILARRLADHSGAQRAAQEPIVERRRARD
ncbi:DEAD/DEAH box helicase [Tessaracoccus oleiagri]|uniref:ATP-dependent helicase Lhr and Lhr-like helicase n=1 Tax=Tessaracoccus oleiagri TaxID=686624 RepID=A0A1G9K1T5_9ACTN|nr:DEAD/DEAH box helicase [Tessaracoccus oleiagri]SDL43797.1 ATP-dependent helicase Lhr and Lhr-like helicase [Tessaracoccus oleiagri]